MSNISPDFIHSIGSLYESIHAQEHEVLIEESEYYDEEISILVEDIISTISLSMVYEGYSAEGIISFLADSSEQNILEKYLTFDENLIIESTITEEYVQEQLEILEYVISEGLGSLAGKVFKGALGLAKRVATKPARQRVAKIMANAQRPERARELLQKVALSKVKPNSKALPGKLTAKQSAELLTKAKIGSAVQKVRDIGSKAKAALTGPTAKKVALGAAGLGAAGLAGGIGGYVGARMAGADSQQPSRPSTPSSTTPSRPSTPPSGGGGGTGGGGGAGSESGSGSRSQRPSQTPSGKSKPGKTPDTKGDTPMQQWAKANPKLAARVKPGQTGYDEIQKTNIPELDKPRPEQKQDQTPTQGSSTAQIDTSSVEKDIEAEKQRQRERAQKTTAAATSGTQKESYDIILEYLIDYGHADSINEANYIMMEMDSQTMKLIIDEYENNIMTEQISTWVNELLEEGYDLSEYTWDDMVEYYLSEY